MDAKEAPPVTDLVAAGKLPPLAQRLPEHPLVVQPYEAPGYYGGTWKMMVDNPDLGMYKMIAGYAPMMRWKADCSGLEPGTA
jgi:peptide/nickel transport system substrate-binding protein